MINQNNPFYGSAGFTPMPGTSYTPQNGNYVTQSQAYQNPYVLQPCAKPAYFVPNPNCCYTPQQYAQFAGASCSGCC